jgi:uracil DNA glycosylase
MKPGERLLASPPASWERLIKASESDLREGDAMLAQSELLYGRSIPSEEYVFLPLYLTPLQSVRMVWVTSEPLSGVSFTEPSKSMSQGLGPGTERTNRPSAEVMALMADEGRRVVHGDLRAWAYQGVLFLSLALTAALQKSHVSKRAPSHAAFWSGFVKRLCEHLQQHRPDTVYVTFGKASSIRQYLSGRAVVLEVPELWDRSYSGTKLFEKINEALPRGSPPISFAF